MRAHTLFALIAVGTASLACTCGGNGGRETDGIDTSPYTYDHETPEDTATEDIPVMEPTGSFCNVGFSEGPWEGEPGSWRGEADLNSILTCTSDGDEVVFTIEVDGNLENDRLRFPIKKVSFARGDVSVWFYKYMMTGGSGEFVMDGRSSNGDWLWGHIEGTIELTDTVEGLEMDLEELELVSWPHF